MNRGAWMIVLLLAAAVGWWYSPLSPRVPSIPAVAADGEAPVCPPPDGPVSPDAPMQSPVPQSMQPIRLQAAALQPLAGIRLEARVLGREDYRSGRESELSPTDLALGWGRMREDAVLRRLEISQSGRWYYYRWTGDPPLPPREITASSANMHFIPADASAARALAAVREGEHVRIEGWLVEARAPDGWTWRSSLVRDDSGDGACELVYVCSLRRL